VNVQMFAASALVKAFASRSVLAVVQPTSAAAPALTPLA